MLLVIAHTPAMSSIARYYNFFLRSDIALRSAVRLSNAHDRGMSFGVSRRDATMDSCRRRYRYLFDELRHHFRPALFGHTLPIYRVINSFKSFTYILFYRALSKSIHAAPPLRHSYIGHVEALLAPRSAMMTLSRLVPLPAMMVRFRRDTAGALGHESGWKRQPYYVS